MGTVECVGNRILELCRKKNLSINGLARSPGIVTIKMICDGFCISLVEFFDTKEFRELEQELQ